MITTPGNWVIITGNILSFLSQNIWPIIILFFIFIFRNPLGSLIERIISFDFSCGDTKGAIKTIGSYQQLDKSENKMIVQKKDSDEGVSEEEKIVEDEYKGDWFGEMFTAFSDKDYVKADSVFQKYKKEETDVNKQMHNEAIYLYLAYSKQGDTTAIDRLKRLVQLANEKNKKIEMLSWLSICYKTSKNYVEAEKLWIAAIAEFEGLEEKTECIKHLVDVYKSNNKLNEAAQLLDSEIKIVTTDKEKSILYKSISEIEKERGNSEVSALALEKVIEFNPDNKEFLFDAAYAQSAANMGLLAINNYDTLIKLDPDHPSALNNLGVEANSYELPTKAIEFYERSVEKGSTLAMANLAQRYLDNGFLGDAQKTIKKAQGHDEPHGNVPQVITGIQLKQDNDKKIWENALKKGNEYRKFIRQYTSAYFNEGTGPADFSGMWAMGSQSQIEFKVHKNKLSAEWFIESSGISPVKFKCSISGTIHNNSAMVTYNKEPLGQKTELGLLAISQAEKHECFAYIGLAKNEINIMSKGPKENFLEKFHREEA